MNIAQYTALTGITVTAEQTPRIVAEIRRQKALLENLLGFSLSPSVARENQYEELGRRQSDSCSTYVEGEELLAADEPVGSYRLFPYDSRDEYFKIDPFTKVHAVKLVYVGSGEDPTGITHKTFDQDRIRVHKSSNGISKYLQNCPDCLCVCVCESRCVQLAVDANWLNEECLPDDLLYLWADMVTFNSNAKRDVKSETLGPHSYSKFDRRRPEEESSSIKIIKKYAGPDGSISISLTL